MANLNLYLIIGSIVIWLIIVILIYKLFCDRYRELKLINEIKTDVKSVREEIKSLTE